MARHTTATQQRAKGFWSIHFLLLPLTFDGFPIALVFFLILPADQPRETLEGGQKNRKKKKKSNIIE